jgi:hypothetical protein
MENKCRALGFIVMPSGLRNALEDSLKRPTFTANDSGSSVHVSMLGW